MTRRTLGERFWEQIQKTETCWLWTGSLTRGGYGQIRADGRLQYVHRISCALVGHPIPEDLTADHLCRVRNCVNPDHIEAVSFRENVLRGIGPTADNARRGLCKKGHQLLQLFTEHRRDCRECTRERSRAGQARIRERKRKTASEKTK